MTVTLGEGNTPLLHAPRLSERLGVELWLKCEGAEPDRLVQGPRDDASPSTRAVEAGATRRRLRVDREHRRVGGRVRGARRASRR